MKMIPNEYSDTFSDKKSPSFNRKQLIKDNSAAFTKAEVSYFVIRILLKCEQNSAHNARRKNCKDGSDNTFQPLYSPF